MFDLPEVLRRQLDTEVEGVPFPDLLHTVTALGEAYRSGQIERTPRLDSAHLALAYAAYRMPGTYAALRTVLDRCQQTIPGLAPRTVADIGGGTGAGAWAAAGCWPSLETITIHDRSRPAAEIGLRLAATGPDPLPTAQWMTTPLAGPVDVAMTGYLLGELTPADQSILVGAMIEHAPTVVVVEPGTTDGYHRILAARAALLEAGMAIAAPCPHAEQCPLEGSDWCHFAARFTRSSTLRRLKGAEHGHDDEKFSYVVGTRLPTVPAANRIIRHPQKRSGLVILQLCDGDGTAHSLTVSKRQGPPYRSARDARWGDPWPPD